MDRKGEIVNSFIMVFILAGVLVGLALLFFVYTLLAPPIISSVDSLSSNVQGAAGQNQQIGTTINNTAIPIAESIHTTEWIGYGALVSLVFGFMIICLTVRSYPFLIYVWLGLGLVVVILSIFIANAYNGVSGGNVGATSYQSLKGNDFIIGNLPLVMGGIMLVGGIILFVLVSRDTEAGTPL